MTWETFDSTKSPFWTPIETGRAYSAKLTEFGAINVSSALKFAEELSRVKSPMDFANVMANHAREQFESLTEQVEEWSALVENSASENDEEEGVGLGD